MIKGHSDEQEFEEKFIRLFQIADDDGENGVAYPETNADRELLQSLTGLMCFPIDDYSDVLNMVAEHGYTLEVLLNPDLEDMATNC